MVVNQSLPSGSCSNSPNALQKLPSRIDRLISSHPDPPPTQVGSVRLNAWAYSPYIHKAVRRVAQLCIHFKLSLGVETTLGTLDTISCDSCSSKPWDTLLPPSSRISCDHLLAISVCVATIGHNCSKGWNLPYDSVRGFDAAPSWLFITGRHKSWANQIMSITRSTLRYDGDARSGSRLDIRSSCSLAGNFWLLEQQPQMPYDGDWQVTPWRQYRALSFVIFPCRYQNRCEREVTSAFRG